MDEKNEVDKIDEVMLPGFRFHPTDEELVGFYLMRKIQQQSIPIELIKQVDIYKYDPWDLPTPAKRLLDKNLPANDSWAICRIFKKTNSMAQRTLSHSWVSPLPETTASDMFTQGSYSTDFSSGNISCITETGSGIQLCSNNDLQQASTASFSALDIPSYKPMNSTIYKPSPFCIPTGDLPGGFMFSPLEMSGPTNRHPVDIASMLFNLSPAFIGDDSKTSGSIVFAGQAQQFNRFPTSSQLDLEGSIGTGDDDTGLRKNHSATHVNNQWGNARSIEFPFSFPSSLPDTWKPNLFLDSPPS
ncbi:unnamed protein product [Ilex paraguariensis]|uniref:NAC domain-containing protein n=1 Tax=Ilex paraguariensis TaxID=185542 RepID=A0ABC8UAZ7_9AQUA